MMSDQPAAISVILGRVSTEDGDRVLETLAALEPDRVACGCEIVIADRLRDGISERIAREFPHVRLVPQAPGTALPTMRAAALAASTGAIVAVTEDHCVPAPGWLPMLRRSFADEGDDLAALGGSVVNGVTGRGLDWATFLTEYSYFSPPVAEGASAVLPGMNVGYRRAALEAVDPALLHEGFWETTVHPALLAAGGRLVSRNALEMIHAKRFSFRLFAGQRFIYSRYFAGVRFRDAGLPKRIAAAAASLLLPPLLFWRMIGAARRKGLGREFWRASPYLAVFVVIWAVGESVGALLGPADALARIE